MFEGGFIQKTISSYLGISPKYNKDGFFFSFAKKESTEYNYVHYIVGTLRFFKTYIVHYTPLKGEREGPTGLRMNEVEGDII